MENKVITAEELLKKHNVHYTMLINGYKCIELLIEFAQMHTKAAFEAAAKEAKVCKDLGEDDEGKQQFEITECYYDEEGYPIYV